MVHVLQGPDLDAGNSPVHDLHADRSIARANWQGIQKCHLQNLMKKYTLPAQRKTHLRESCLMCYCQNISYTLE